MLRNPRVRFQEDGCIYSHCIVRLTYRASSFMRFLDHTQRRTIVGSTPPYKWSARRTDLYLATHNTHKTDIYAPGGIRTHIPSRRAAAALRLRKCGHWDRQEEPKWVGIAIGRFGDRIPVWGEIFHIRPDRPWGPPSLQYCTMHTASPSRG